METVKAVQAINQGRWMVGRGMIAETKDPLAAKLYYWLLFTRKTKDQSFTRLAQFVHQNPEWPGMNNLRLRIEDQIPETMSATDVVTWFKQYPPLTVEGMDRYVQALITLGKTKEAKLILADWWANMLFSREHQKEFYRKYKAYIGIEEHRKRFDTVLFAGQYINARAIAGVLKNGYPELAEARIALAENKSNVNALIDKVPSRLQRDPGLLYERLRWRRRHDLDVEAMEILHRAPPANDIHNLKDWWRERHIIARRLIEKKHYESAYLLVSSHMQESGLAYAQAEWLSGWLALRFLDKLPEALQHFEALYAKVSTPVSKARAAYWAGRASKAIGNEEISLAWFKKAARYQTVFYGQLAGAELGIEKALPNAAPPKLSPQDIQSFNAMELIQAAQIFNAAGMRKDSSRFITAFINHETTPKAYRFASELAADMKQYHDAIRLAKDATQKGMFLTAQSYPLILDKVKSSNVEWALVHALIRQESVFDYDARSPAGALGLMQLMPSTASAVARGMGISHNTVWLTSRPDHNILLGSRYLKQMLARFDGSYPLAIAAYNAGPGRVEKWIKLFGDPRKGEVDLIDWIELIPIYETRNYVQRVMEGTYVYRLRLKGIQNMPEGNIHIAMPVKY